MIWITGLPCSGKTSLGRALKKEFEKNEIKSLLLDGDDLRRTMNIDYADKNNFSEEKRKELSETYSRFAKLIEDQGILTIVSTVSMNNYVRELNKEIHKNYFEIYIKESYEILKQRDNKGIYNNLSTFEIEKMWEKAERPLSSDVIIPMEKNLNLDECVNLIINAFFKK